MYPPGMDWGRIAVVRTVILILVGLGALVAAAFIGLGVWAGLAALGIACLFLEFMTGGAPRGNPAQR
jgi:hypothetical protein